MSPKEKAEELIDKYSSVDLQPLSEFGDYMIDEAAKQCAIIAVDEIMRFPKTLLYTMYVHRFRTVDEIDINNWNYEEPIVVDEMTALEYWHKVKQELESL